MNAYRNTLSKAYPLERRVHVRQHLWTRASIHLGDPPTDAVNLAFDGSLAISHEGYYGLISGSNVGDGRLSEKAAYQKLETSEVVSRPTLVPKPFGHFCLRMGGDNRS